MLGDISNPSPMDTLSFGEMQKPFKPAADNEQLFFSISSSGYYGFQPLRGENVSEPMHVDDSNKSFIKTCRGVKRKLATDPDRFSTWKRKCHYGKHQAQPPL